MKKLLLFMLLVVPLLCVQSQTKKQKQKFEDYKTQEYFQVDEPNVVVSRVIEDLDGDKNVLYVKVKSIFARFFTKSTDVIEVDDKEAGVIIGKLYMDVASWSSWSLSNNRLGAEYMIRIDIKDGRIRAICNASRWAHASVGLFSEEDWDASEGYILDYAPFTKKRLIDKGVQTEAFFRLIDQMHSLIDEIDVSLRKGVVKQENDGW